MNSHLTRLCPLFAVADGGRRLGFVVIYLSESLISASPSRYSCCGIPAQIYVSADSLAHTESTFHFF